MFCDVVGWFKFDVVICVDIVVVDSVFGVSVIFVYLDLLVGCYVLLVFYDVNNDVKFGINLVGIFIELYGFSCDVCGCFGLFVFDDVVIDVQGDQCVMIYLY